MQDTRWGWESCPSPEVQSVYSTAPADWTNINEKIALASYNYLTKGRRYLQLFNIWNIGYLVDELQVNFISLVYYNFLFYLFIYLFFLYANSILSGGLLINEI